MSDCDENIHPANPQRQFDLLVDGELSEAERRTLLLHLEREPDGWRRCALAFLEAQCWKAELGQISPPGALESADVGPVSQTEPRGRRQTWRQHVATLLTMAASFLLALVLGMGLRNNWSGGSSHLLSSELIPAVAEVPLAGRGAAQSSAASSGPALPADDLEMVTLDCRSSDGQNGTFCVPALHRDALDRNMLEHIPDAIPPDVRQAFERSGHRVVQQREIVPLQMKDGRRLVVPVDHVEIHYVGRPSL